MNILPIETACIGALDLACTAVGSQKKLAELLGIRSPSISEWRKRGRVPSRWCLRIEGITEGRVTRYELRPDIFGAAPVELQEAS